MNQVAASLVWCCGGGVDLSDQVRVDTRRLIRSGLTMLAPEGAVPAPRTDGDPHAYRDAACDPELAPPDRLGVDLIEDEGELLSDWDDEWLAPDRERFRQLRLHLLEVTAERLSAQGYFGLAMEAALAAAG